MKDLPLYTIISLTYGPIVSLSKLHIDHNQSLTQERIKQAAEACWDAVRLAKLEMPNVIIKGVGSCIPIKSSSE